jgi:hypothetical protein
LAPDILQTFGLLLLAVRGTLILGMNIHLGYELSTGYMTPVAVSNKKVQ